MSNNYKISQICVIKFLLKSCFFGFERTMCYKIDEKRPIITKIDPKRCVLSEKEVILSEIDSMWP